MCIVVVGRLYCCSFTCIVVGYPCDVVGWPFVLFLYGCVHCHLTVYNCFFWPFELSVVWLSVIFVVWLFLIVVVWTCVLLFVDRVNCCWLTVFIVSGWPCVLLLFGCVYFYCLAVCIFIVWLHVLLVVPVGWPCVNVVDWPGVIALR